MYSGKYEVAWKQKKTRVSSSNRAACQEMTSRVLNTGRGHSTHILSCYTKNRFLLAVIYSVVILGKNCNEYDVYVCITCMYEPHRGETFSGSSSLMLTSRTSHRKRPRKGWPKRPPKLLQLLSRPRLCRQLRRLQRKKLSSLMTRQPPRL